MKAEDDLARAELAKLPERDAIAARLKELFYIDSLVGAAPPGRARTSSAAATPTRRRRSSTGRRARRARRRCSSTPTPGPPTAARRSAAWPCRGTERRSPTQSDKNNSDEATLYVMDVATGKKCDGRHDRGRQVRRRPRGRRRATASITRGSRPIRDHDADRPGFAEVRFHKLGEDPKKDAVIRERTNNPSSFLGADISRDGHWLLLHVQHGWTFVDLYVKDVRAAQGRFRAARGRQRGALQRPPWPRVPCSSPPTERRGSGPRPVRATADDPPRRARSRRPRSPRSATPVPIPRRWEEPAAEADHAAQGDRQGHDRQRQPGPLSTGEAQQEHRRQPGRDRDQGLQVGDGQQKRADQKPQPGPPALATRGVRPRLGLGRRDCCDGAVRDGGYLPPSSHRRRQPASALDRPGPTPALTRARKAGWSGTGQSITARSAAIQIRSPSKRSVNRSSADPGNGPSTIRQ